MDTERTIAIIGAGKVGLAIGILAAKARLRVVAVADRNAKRAAAAAQRIGPDVRACSRAEDAAAAGQLVLLTVSDDAIEPLCARLAQAGAFFAGTAVAHCCGALGSEALAPARDAAGCHVGTMHPLQTFATVDSALAKLPGAHCFIEGDADAVDALAGLAEAIGALPVAMPAGNRALYHAAAVMACNYLTALLDAAAGLAETAGVNREQYLRAVEPLVRATVDNVFAMGPADALTGPVERGDIRTIERHLDALAAGDEKLAAFYRAAGKWTVALARRKGSIDPSVAQAIERALNGESGKE